LGKVVFLTEFTQKQQRSFRGSRREEADGEEFVRVWIDGGVQPVRLIVQLNHGLVDRDVIRHRLDGWL
jgi:hypothetical protein